MNDIQTIYFNGECPKIGSGMRRVKIISKGYKWVRLECAATKRRARLRRASWNDIEQAASRRQEFTV